MATRVFHIDDRLKLKGFNRLTKQIAFVSS